MSFFVLRNDDNVISKSLRNHDVIRYFFKLIQSENILAVE